MSVLLESILIACGIVYLIKEVANTIAKLLQ